MPIFEYQCDTCGIKFEAINKIAERHTADCTECGVTSHKLLISAVRSKLDPISGDFPGATFKWESNRKQKMAQEAKESE